ncbi:hypothetical protein N3K66_007190 [Trichothecium roseum]|uniref:Uncharacterized protein n=1 Tax=Trichothecium roseum TaxID=47278 RepID=A0ACC0UT64_9HYPO|nr:hypothetical protein N3K66_007190 [Trichothecium roseum]
MATQGCMPAEEQYLASLNVERLFIVGMKQTLLTIENGVEKLTRKIARAPPDQGHDESLRKLVVEVFGAIHALANRTRPAISTDRIADADMDVLFMWRYVTHIVLAMPQTIRSGRFAAAHASLYMAYAFLHQTYLDTHLPDTELSCKRISQYQELGHSIDEVVMLKLRLCWREEEKRGADAFDWVTVGMLKDPTSKFCHINAAALSPGELAGGTDTNDSQGHAPKVSFIQQHILPEKQQDEYPEGSLRQDMVYYLEEAGTTTPPVEVRRPMLRRSWQLVLDSKQRALCLRLEEGARLGNVAGVMGLPDLDVYIAHFDVQREYGAFPSNPASCRECRLAAGDWHTLTTSTCPTGNVIVWNLALRAFHLFHPLSKE